jgi:hypothetical protein
MHSDAASVYPGPNMELTVNRKGSSALNWRWQIVLFAASALVVISRRPDVVLRSQFWAEDGQVWYAQAYNLGWLHALTLPFGGYLNTLPRLVAALSLAVPFHAAPLIMSCIGIVCQVLPCCVLLSSRCSEWGTLRARALYAAVYLALPNSWEINVNVTDAHFHLALVAFLIATGTPARSWNWKAFDLIVIFLTGFTGPWSAVLCPLTLIAWYLRRDRWTLALAALLAICALTQGIVLLTATGEGGRMAAHTGANIVLLLKILADDIFSAAILGRRLWVVEPKVLLLGPIALFGLFIVSATLLKCPPALKLYIIFAATLLTLGLSRPIIMTPDPQWLSLLYIRGARYWFHPMLAFVWSLVWWATQARTGSMRTLSRVLLLCMIFGVIRDWEYAPLPDMHFQEYVNSFARAPRGSEVDIPINPVWPMGPLWMVRLRKK